MKSRSNGLMIPRETPDHPDTHLKHTGISNQPVSLECVCFKKEWQGSIEPLGCTTVERDAITCDYN